MPLLAFGSASSAGWTKMVDRKADLARLQSIADLIGVPVETFTVGTMPKRFQADNECLRLWLGLKTEAGRDAALDALRKILDEEGG